MNENRKNFWTVSFIVLLTVNFLNGTCTYMINPSLPSFLVDKGVLFEYTGIISSILSWVALFIRPFAGALSDAYNRKRLLLVSYFIVCICFFLYPVINSVVLLIVVRIIHGVFFSIAGTVCMSFATNFIRTESLGEGLGYFTLATQVSNIVGPQIGNFINEHMGIRFSFIIASLLECINIILILSLKYEFVRTKEMKRIELKNLFAIELFPLLLFISVFSLGNGIISYYLNSFGIARGIANITVFYSVYSITMVLIKPSVGKLIDKKGFSFVLFPSYFINAAGMFILAGAKSIIPVIIAALCKAFGQGCGTPAIQSEAVKIMGKEKSGVAISTIYIGQDLGNAIGPVYASFMIPVINYGGMFSLYGLLLVSTGLLLRLYCKKRRSIV